MIYYLKYEIFGLVLKEIVTRSDRVIYGLRLDTSQSDTSVRETCLYSIRVNNARICVKGW